MHLAEVTVNWQDSETQEIVHSFYDGKDHLEHQGERFRGRTQLFPQEFSKGNASLLLKRLTLNDTGDYSCHAFLYEETLPSEQVVQLSVSEEGVHLKHGRNRYSLIGFPLLLLVIWCLYESIKKCRSSKSEEALERYREVIRKTIKLCSKRDSGHILNQPLIIIKEKKLHTATEIINYIYRSQERVDTVHAEDLFTTQEQRSTLMLLVGGAGTGKSYISRRLLQKWASGKNKLFYSCVIYIPFSDLNSIENPISVRELLAYKCKELSPVLTDLLNNNHILIILDGLNEFKYDLSYTQYRSSREFDTIDVALPVNTLISKLITRDLLPDIDVLVTAQFHAVSEICKHFNYLFVILECTADHIKQYYDTFTLVNRTLKHNSNSASGCELLALYLFPLQIKILRDTLMKISKSRDIREHNSVLISHGESKENCCVSIESGETDTTGLLPSLELPEHVKEIIYRLGKVSYEHLLVGVQEIKREDLERCHIDPKLLTKCFSSFISQVERGCEIFEYCHDGGRDMFAALYCVQEIQDGEELKRCLDAWVLGHILANYKEESLLKKVTLNHVEKLHNFIRCFMGLLPYRSTESLLHDPVPFNGAIRNSLLEWFEHHVTRDLSQTTTLNLLRCIFELHDASLTEHVSRCFKHIFLYNTPLSAADVGTLQYSLEKTTLDKVVLRGCGLGDAGLEQLSSVIRSSREVWISYNKLTEKSGRVLQNVLEHRDCAIESLSQQAGTHCAKCLWKALEKNCSLKSLNLYDNDIGNEGTKGLAQSLEKNRTLQELILCPNCIGKAETQNITYFLKHREDLKVVMKITDDERLVSYVADRVQRLSGELQRYDTELVLYVLQNLQNELEDEENLSDQMKENITTLKKNIAQLLADSQT